MSMTSPRRGPAQRTGHRAAIAGSFIVGAVVVGSVAALVISVNRNDTAREIPKGIPPAPGVAVPFIDINAPGRTADLLRDWAAPISEETSIPVLALEAYGVAAETMRQTRPECQIGWTTVAGIAAVESRHGTYRGASIAANGDVSPPIRGVVLNGTQGNAHIVDTDRGALDGDPTLDRAVGPLQFIPETWRRFGVDANGDGVANPDNIDDAALSAARYLCVSGGELDTAAGWEKAVLTYNASREYLLDVRDKAAEYGLATGG